MTTATMSYGDKVTAVRRALAREGIQMTAGKAREEGGRYAGGRAAGGSKPIVLKSDRQASLAVMDSRGDMDAARKMLAGLTEEERAAVESGGDAERKWEAGEGDPGMIRRQAKRSDEKIRRAIERRKAEGEAEDIEAMTPLGFLLRVMRRGGSEHTVKAFPYGHARKFHSGLEGEEDFDDE